MDLIQPDDGLQLLRLPGYNVRSSDINFRELLRATGRFCRPYNVVGYWSESEKTMFCVARDVSPISRRRKRSGKAMPTIVIWSNHRPAIVYLPSLIRRIHHLCQPEYRRFRYTSEEWFNRPTCGQFNPPGRSGARPAGNEEAINQGS
jgi:hypothetical protein